MGRMYRLFIILIRVLVEVVVPIPGDENLYADVDRLGGP